MQEGWVAEYSMNGVHPNAWMSGHPERSLLKGTKVESDGTAIATFACPSCGYLESFVQVDPK